MSPTLHPAMFLVPLPEPKDQSVRLRVEFAHNVRSLHISVRLAISATVLDLKHAIVELLGRQRDSGSFKNEAEPSPYDDDGLSLDIELQDLVIAEVVGSTVIHIKTDDRLLTSIRSIDRLVAVEVLTLDTGEKDTRFTGSWNIPGFPIQLVSTGQPGTIVHVHAPALASGHHPRVREGSDATPKGSDANPTLKHPNPKRENPNPNGRDPAPGDSPRTLDVQVHRSSAGVNQVSPHHDEDIEPALLPIQLHRGLKSTQVRPRTPRVLVVTVVSRKFHYRSVSFMNPFHVTVFGSPFLLRFIPEHCSGLDLYSLIWHKVKSVFDSTTDEDNHVHSRRPSGPVDWAHEPPSAYTSTHDTDKRDWTTRKPEELFTSTLPCGFILRRVDRQFAREDPREIIPARASFSNRPPWLNRQYGTIIPCSSLLPCDVLEHEVLALDWHTDVRSEYHLDHVLQSSSQSVAHASVAKNDLLDRGTVSLNVCLSSFTRLERLEGETTCSHCRATGDMTKTLNIWRLPPVMVIHLKRFQYTPAYRRKLSTLIEFPLRNLELEPYIALNVGQVYPHKGPKEDGGPEREDDAGNLSTNENGDGNLSTNENGDGNLSTNDHRSPATRSAAPATAPSSPRTTAPAPRAKLTRGYTDTNLEHARCLETTYNLYGVVNHHGALGGGHYTAMAKNSVDGLWYSYDDERVCQMEEEDIVTSEAYLLFYIRTDMDGVSIKDIYPERTREGKVTEEEIQQLVREQEQKKCTIS